MILWREMKRHLAGAKVVPGKVTTISTVALCFLTLLASQAQAQPVQSPSPEPASSEMKRITMPLTIFPTPLDAASAFVRNFPESLEGKQKLTVTAEPDIDHKDRLLVTVMAEGLLDDSVDTEQWLIRLKPVEGGWKLNGMTMRSQCARGDNAGSWKVGSCP